MKSLEDNMPTRVHLHINILVWEDKKIFYLEFDENK